MDEGLLALLLGNVAIKKQFFKDVADVLVFDKVAFQSFVSNKQFLPDSYTAFKNKIGLTANGEYLTESGEVVLAWTYKDCTLEGGQTKEEQKRKEIFWNETLAPDEIDRLLDPKVLTHFKRYDKDGEHEVARISMDDNLIIKGNNLLALHCLKKQYAGKVKLIYIDPPYNTGSDSFGYNDSFNHSTWLTFMRNRLKVARELLRSDGVIFVQCDDNEQAYLKVLMDEVFGRENFRNLIISKVGTKNVQNQFDTWEKLSTACDLLLFYSKSNNYRFPKAEKSIDTKSGAWNNHWRGTDRPTMRYDIFGVLPETGQWRWSKDRSLIAIKAYNSFLKKLNKTTNITQKEIDDWYLSQSDDIDLLRLSKTGKPEHYIPPTNKQSINNVWMDLKSNGNAETKKLFDVKAFDTPKSEALLQRIIELSTQKGDTVLDYHLGSGTTATVAHKMGRRYIGIEQMDYIRDVTCERLKKVIAGEQGGISKAVNWQGGGSFTYCELRQHNANIIDKIEQASTSKTLKAIWREMENTDFISYKIKPETVNQNIHEFEALSVAEQKQFLIAVLDKNQLYVNYSEIEDVDYQISDDDKKLNKQFYGDS